MGIYVIGTQLELKLLPGLPGTIVRVIGVVICRIAIQYRTLAIRLDSIVNLIPEVSVSRPFRTCTIEPVNSTQ